MQRPWLARTFRIAERLGMTQGELVARMSAAELVQWAAIERQEVEDQRRAMERARRAADRPPEGSEEALRRELAAKAARNLESMR